MVYVFAGVGMPVYLHYCGGNLEEVSYLVKANNCCGETEEEAGDCCRNEHIFIKYNPDFSFQQQKTNFSAFGTGQLISLILPSYQLKLNQSNTPAVSIQKHFPPPKIYQKTLSDCTLLRI